MTSTPDLDPARELVRDIKDIAAELPGKRVDGDSLAPFFTRIADLISKQSACVEALRAVQGWADEQGLGIPVRCGSRSALSAMERAP